jgi:hypothetical protein
VAAWPVDAFARWYAIYPRKKQRKAAEKAFQKVRVGGEITFDSLLAATQRHAAAVKDEDPKFIPYPASWLNAGSYLDEDDKPLGNGSRIAEPERKPTSFNDADWLSRLKAHDSGSLWPEQHWGPRPGEPGCLVPSHLLDGTGAILRRNGHG